MKKKNLIIGLLLALSLTGCGKTKEEKLTEYLEDSGYKCSGLNCEKTSNGITKKVYKNVDHTLFFEIETDDVTFKITEKAYIDKKAPIKVDNYAFISDSCDSELDCTINIGDKVYPKDHKSYLEYIESDEYQEYLNLKDRYNLSTADSYDLLLLEMKYELYDSYRKYEKYTDDVNKYKREFEEYMEEYK